MMLKDIFDFDRKDSEVRFFFFLCAGLTLILLVSYIVGAKIERGDISAPTKTVEAFPQVELKARAAYVYDARTKEVYFAKNEDQRLPLASLTKVMSALVARGLSPQYSTLTVEPEALKAMGDNGIRANERWNLSDLLDYALVTSSNDGMRAVALALGALEKSNASEDEKLNSFVNMMNKKASELGLKNTYFWNETGLDESEYKGGAYGTAKDITRLMEHVLITHPDLLEATSESAVSVSSLNNIVHEGKNTNDLANWIPGLIASKTGYTNTAGGNLTLAFDPELGRPIIVTVLGSTEEGRFEDVRTLIKASLEYIAGK